jgi:dTDP-4-dehydrorhamnose 3,5-epimerase-like enzyme
MNKSLIESVDFESNNDIRPQVYDIPLHIDDRGSVHCIRDNLIEDMIQRTYIVENYSRGLVRCWHGHKKGDTYMHVISGAAKIAAMNMDNYQDVTIATLTSRKPQLFYIPAGFYNGALTLTDNTKILVYSTLTFNQVKHDDERLDWNVRTDIWEVKNR